MSNFAAMKLIEAELPDAAAHLALDEVLLETAATGAVQESECLRLWEIHNPAVVIGRSSRVFEEVHVPACRQDEIPVRRRFSGGAAVVVGSGCLVYSLVLSRRQRPELTTPAEIHCHVLRVISEALGKKVAGIRVRGTSDLAIGDLKFSGNSVRISGPAVLYHGTMLYDLPLSVVGTYLAQPSRQPDYRAQRMHEDFLTMLPLAREQIANILVDAWQAYATTADWPRLPVEVLAREKYRNDGWTFQR